MTKRLVLERLGQQSVHFRALPPMRENAGRRGAARHQHHASVPSEAAETFHRFTEVLIEGCNPRSQASPVCLQPPAGSTSVRPAFAGFPPHPWNYFTDFLRWDRERFLLPSKSSSTVIISS